MRIILTSFFLIIFSNSFSQNLVGYFIKDDGTKVEIYDKLVTYRQNIFSIKTKKYLDSPSLSSYTLIYYNKDGKQKEINQKSIRELYTSNTKYISLPTTSKGNIPRLHRVIAYSTEYTFTTYRTNTNTIYYVFDKNDEFKESIVCTSRPYDKDNDVIKKFMVTLDTYFAECPKLKEVLNSELVLKSEIKTSPIIVLFGAMENTKLECNKL